MAPMEVVQSFHVVLQVVSGVMTAPTAQTFQTLVAGWLLAPRRSIIGMVRSSGTERHHSAFHRLFATAAWSIDKAGLAVFDLITRGQERVFLAIDDTLIERFGLKVHGTGMHRNAVQSSRSHVVTTWGNCWVVLCVVLESRWMPGRRFCLPVLCRLYVNKSSAQKWNIAYRKKNELMIEMLNLLSELVDSTEKTLHLLGDSAFTVPAALKEMPVSIHVTGRAKGNYRVHDAPEKRKKGQRGRSRKRGKRLLTPSEMFDQKGLQRMSLKLYDHSKYRIRVATQVGFFHKAPDREVLVIAIEHLKGGRGREYFYTTDLEADIETVLKRYSWRWGIEVMFHEVKDHLGIGEPENRTQLAVERTAFTGFLLYTLITWWHETGRETPAKSVRNWRGKSHPSFADMLAALREESLQNTYETNFATLNLSPNIQKLLNHLKNLIALAA